jgi:hypothetical protein
MSRLLKLRRKLKTSKGNNDVADRSTSRTRSSKSSERSLVAQSQRGESSSNSIGVDRGRGKEKKHRRSPFAYDSTVDYEEPTTPNALSQSFDLPPDPLEYDPETPRPFRQSFGLQSDPSEYGLSIDERLIGLSVLSGFEDYYSIDSRWGPSVSIGPADDSNFGQDEGEPAKNFDPFWDISPDAKANAGSVAASALNKDNVKAEIGLYQRHREIWDATDTCVESKIVLQVADISSSTGQCIVGQPNCGSYARA